MICEKRSVCAIIGKYMIGTSWNNVFIENAYNLNGFMTICYLLVVPVVVIVESKGAQKTSGFPKITHETI